MSLLLPNVGKCSHLFSDDLGAATQHMGGILNWMVGGQLGPGWIKGEVLGLWLPRIPGQSFCPSIYMLHAVLGQFY